eukprot:gnl/MRDRNA2_/MRDRNA2_260099_c0_seq1.p1 gnl/MRDRNA2_/MRDRNA2_260099_c0~~gnl/MRDRNA2_/MRDRNA2_260099_c0_seq1.p1  ORF type:complete len:402 (+),score=53.20 gnl/MRDRNA2_/MRDRNA2_260099_c0_seq1:68-1207(+)
MDHALGDLPWVAVGGCLDQLLPHIIGNPWILRTCDQLLPFNAVASSVDQVSSAVSAFAASEASESACLFRLCCFPRCLEKTLIAALPSEILNPSRFSHCLSVVQCEPFSIRSESSTHFLYCITTRKVWDPHEWRELAKGHDHGSSSISDKTSGEQQIEASSNGFCKTQRLTALHLSECYARLGCSLQIKGQVVLVVADVEAQITAMVQWSLGHGAQEVLAVQARKTADLQWHFAVSRDLSPCHGNTAIMPPICFPCEADTPELEMKSGYNSSSITSECRLRDLLRLSNGGVCNPKTVFFRYERGLEDTVQALSCILRLGIEAKNVTLVGKVKLGQHGRARNVEEHIATTCSAENFEVAVHHLLVDRELERTLVLSVDGR